VARSRHDQLFVVLVRQGRVRLLLHVGCYAAALCCHKIRFNRPLAERLKATTGRHGMVETWYGLLSRYPRLQDPIRDPKPSPGSCARLLNIRL